MTIAAVITGGFGSSFGTIAGVITEGYLGGGSVPVVVAPVHDGGDGASKKELDALRRRHRQALASRNQSEDKRQRAEERLGQALATAYAKVFGAEPEPEAVQRVAVAVGSDALTQEPNWGAVASDMALARQAIAAIEDEMTRRAEAWRRAESIRLWVEQDEDDVELLLLSI